MYICPGLPTLNYSLALIEWNNTGLFFCCTSISKRPVGPEGLIPRHLPKLDLTLEAMLTTDV